MAWVSEVHAEQVWTYLKAGELPFELLFVTEACKECLIRCRDVWSRGCTV